MLTDVAVGRFGAHTLAKLQDAITRVLGPGGHFANPMLRSVAVDA
jgi:hypothetical protein